MSECEANIRTDIAHTLQRYALQNQCLKIPLKQATMQRMGSPDESMRFKDAMTGRPAPTYQDNKK